MAELRLLIPVAMLVGSASSAAQLVQPGKVEASARFADASAPLRLDAIDAAESARVRALVGDLGGPELPPVLPGSPRDQMMYADRVPVVPRGLAQYAGQAPPIYLEGKVPAGPGGTGTDKPEFFWYQIPAGYDAESPALPLVIAYHGYGNSAGSVATQSTIDEECNARGWLYVAPTGIDDKLFGAPVSQANTAAAVQWMLDHFHVDADRIYMVGFSLGGGISANFAARHRDPAGLMIAALGIVSGSLDWTMSWELGLPPLKSWMENAYNFGASPQADPWAYQRSSALHVTSGSYPPLPGTLDAALSMAANLGATPAYVTWDLDDTLPEIVTQQPVLVDLLQSLGGAVESHPITGTPVAHSWDVLDEPALFDFFAQHVAQRTPAAFHALADGDVAVSWAGLVQAAPHAFSRVDGNATASPATLSVTTLDNVAQVVLHADLGGLAGPGPVHVAAGAVNGAPALLRVDGLGEPPAYFADARTGALIPGAVADPAADALLLVLPAPGTFDGNLVTHALWTTDFTVTPTPIAPGGTLDVSLDAPAGARTAWLFIGLGESLATLKGVPFTVALTPLTLVPLPLDGAGDLHIPAALPSDPLLSSGSLFFQTAVTGPGSAIQSVSNLWRIDIL